jgi:hypothetical protein
MTTLSPDRRHYWNGQAWMPVPPAEDTATWWSDAPDWMGPVAVNGLTLLIPVVGQMVVYGWVLAARDELRAGRNLVPLASFAYLSRGWRPFVAQLVWGLCCWVALVALGAALGASIGAAAGEGGPWGAVAVLLGVLVALAVVAAVVLQLVLVVPVLAICAEVGLAAALHPGYVWGVMRAYPIQVRRGAVIYLIGQILSFGVGLMFFCLLVGGVFCSAGAQLCLAAPLAHAAP